MRRALLATIILAAATLTPATPAFAQQAAVTSTRDLGRTRTEFLRVRDRMQAVQRELDRAARNNAPAVREAALLDWQRALEGLEPYVNELSPQVPDERAMIDQYEDWSRLYREAVGPARAGEYFLQITKYWTEVTAGTEGWEDEATPATFDSILKADAEDASARTLGMPKTVAFVKAVNTYLSNVAAREDYDLFKNLPNEKKDREQAEAARDRAYQKLAKVADAVLTDAEKAKLDQNSRDRVERFVDEDLSAALAGYEQQGKLQARGRTLIYNYDKGALGDSEAAEKSMARLTAAADRAWPTIVASYAAHPMAPVGQGRGQIVRVTGAKNRIGKEFGVDTYDFAGFIDGAPVVGNFVPAVRENVNDTLALTSSKSLPDDATYDFVAIVRGTTQVPNVRQRPGATTAPANADPVTAATAPATTDCVVLDIVALHAGPVAVGTKVIITPQR